MKASLLTTAAAIAMIATPQLALAQKQDAPPSNVQQTSPPPAAQRSAPAEKVAPAGPVAPAPDRAAQGRPETGTTPAQPGAQPNRNAQTPASPPAARQADETKPGAKPAMNADTKSGAKPAMNADTKAAPDGDKKPGATAQSGAAPALSAEQKTKIRSTILQGSNAPRVTNVNFSINVGTVVPRTVKVVSVPATLVEVYPAWRGHLYFVHGDEIIIVERDTLRIVAVLEV